MPATTIENLQQAFLEIGRQLRIPGLDEEQADVKMLVQRHLSQQSTELWLLIFDNADDIDMWIGTADNKDKSPSLIDCLPKSSQGSVIFTTRSRKTALRLAPQNIIEVAEMHEDVATQVLSKALINPELLNDRQNTVKLLQRLTYLPLAIVQAAAYMNENEITVLDYLSLLIDKEQNVIELLSEDVEDEGRYRMIKNPVATTWLISFEHIRYRDPLAAEYLSFISCLDPKHVPQSLLPPAPSRKKGFDAIGTLSAYSFIIKRSADQSFDLHRLVHLAARNWLRTEGSLAEWTARAVARLDQLFLKNGNRYRMLWRTYLPHVRYIYRSEFFQEDLEGSLSLLQNFGLCLLSDGRYNEVERPLLQVLEARKKVLGHEHQDTLTAMANLAWIYRRQGRWDKAEGLEIQVVKAREVILGKEHLDTLTSMRNLASTYRKQGRWKEAEELDSKVMTTSKRVLAAFFLGRQVV